MAILRQRTNGKKSSSDVKVEETSFQKSNTSGSPFLLLICASGICGCYLYFGIVQERVFSKGSASNAIKQVGSITSFMLVLSCITNVLVALLWISTSQKLFPKQRESNGSDKPLNHMILFGNAFFYFAAMTASNEALSYVSYPTAVLAKSSKLIPTMLVGFLIEKKAYSVQEWLSAAFITGGITIFNLSRLSKDQSDDGDSIFGLFLLLFSLVMDGMLASFQNRLKVDQKKYRTASALECMLWVNLYAIIFMLPLSIATGQFQNGLKLFRPLDDDSIDASSTSSLSMTILWLNLTAAAGQIFIFFTISLFSPIMCTTITTTRKFFTILLSVWKFGHHFTVAQWTSILMVFGGLYLAIVSKFSSKDKIETTKEENKKNQ